MSSPPSIYAPSDDVIHNGEAWASTHTLDPWEPCILALDGGGIRGYSSLLILRALMHEIAEWERKLDRETPAALANGHAPECGPIAVSAQNTLTLTDSTGPRLDVPLARGRSGSPKGQGNDVGSDGPATPRSSKRTLREIDESTLLPCHYFDFIYGTSTGGLIATMLGRLRMTVPQCLEIYRQVGNELFGTRRSYVPLMTKYHHRPLEDAVREIVKTYCKQHPGGDECRGTDWHPWELEIKTDENINLDAHICQSVCLTAKHDGRIDKAHLLRTYNHQYVEVPNWITPYNTGADELKIWQVTRATSAAPFYFEDLVATIRGEKYVFKDGGIRENNPSGAAWSEFISLYGEGKDPALLLSIGTGKPNEANDGFANAWPGPFGSSTLMKKAAQKFAVLKNALVKYTAGEVQHRAMLRQARGENSWYKRLNVSSGLEALPLDSWKRGEWTDPATGVTAAVPGGETLSKMEAATHAYLARGIDHQHDSYAAPGVMLAQAAEKLVRQRRAREATRAANPRRWDTYMGKWISGTFSDAPDGPVEHPVSRKPSAGSKTKPSVSS